jgi:hypothetical protein
VELASFDVTQNGRGRAILSWTTTSEQNNAGFIVRHRNGKEQWTDLGFVESAVPGGTATQMQTYEYAVGDLQPGKQEFRLVQEDLDGTMHSTRSVSIVLAQRNGVSLSGPTPHPVSGSSILSFSVTESGPVTLRVFNLLGQEVATLYDGNASAHQSISVRFSVEHLAAGSYFLRLRSGKTTRSRNVKVVP